MCRERDRYGLSSAIRNSWSYDAHTIGNKIEREGEEDGERKKGKEDKKKERDDEG